MNYRLLSIFAAAVIVASCSAAENAANKAKEVSVGGVAPLPHDPSTRLIRIPAAVTFEERSVIVEEAKTREVSVPPTYRTVQKRVIDRPARTVERVAPAPTRQITRTDPVTGETRTETIVAQEAYSEVVVIPPTYRTVTEKVIDKEASTRIVTVPPVFRTERVQILKPKHPFTWALDPENNLPYLKPPPTTVKEDIDNRYFTVTEEGRSRRPNLREVFDKLTSVLSSHESLDYGYRVYKYEKGFAILTDPERIHNDGTIHIDEDGERIDMRQQNATNFKEYIEAFLRPPENRVRYIAFIVTSKRHIEPTSNPATQQMLDVVFQSGGTRRSIPLEILEQYEFDDSYRVQVRVYEFPTMPKVKTAETDDNILEAGLNQETRLVELSTYDPSEFTPIKFKNHTRGSFVLDEIFKSN